MIVKTLDAEVVAKVESLAYEFEARKSVVTEMLAQDMDTSTDAFARYQAELVKYKAAFEAAKKEIEDQFVADVKGWTNWNLDYASRTLTISEPGDPR